MLLTDFLLPSPQKWDLSEWNSLWKNPPHPGGFIYSSYLRSRQREEKPIWYSATSSKYVFASVKHNTFGDGHISLLNGPDLA